MLSVEGNLKVKVRVLGTFLSLGGKKKPFEARPSRVRLQYLSYPMGLTTGWSENLMESMCWAWSLMIWAAFFGRKRETSSLHSVATVRDSGRLGLSKDFVYEAWSKGKGIPSAPEIIL